MKPHLLLLIRQSATPTILLTDHGPQFYSIFEKSPDKANVNLALQGGRRSAVKPSIS